MDTLLGVQIVKSVVETALMLFAARGVMRLLFFGAGARAERNFVYLLCRAGTEPLVRLVRLLAPPVVLDRHLPFAAFGLLLAAWLGLCVAKVGLCADLPSHAACTGAARVASVR